MNCLVNLVQKLVPLSVYTISARPTIENNSRSASHVVLAVKNFGKNTAGQRVQSSIIQRATYVPWRRENIGTQLRPSGSP